MKANLPLATVLAAVLPTALTACQTTALPPIETVARVELERFMGDWYVIANIPTYIERGAHNAVESYRRNNDGSIDTTFTFRADSFDGELKRYNPTGFVLDTASNAVWGMQFIWPFKSDYRIVYLTPDYSQTIIGREKRDHVWIMARTPAIPEQEYSSILRLLERQGYDIARVQKVPQRWEKKP